MNQTVRDVTHVAVRRSHFHEEEFQENEEDLFNILDADRQHGREVERTYDRMEEANSCANSSKIEKDGSRRSLQARMGQLEGKTETKRKFLKKTDLSNERLKDQFTPNREI